MISVAVAQMVLKTYGITLETMLQDYDDAKHSPFKEERLLQALEKVAKEMKTHQLPLIEPPKTTKAMKAMNEMKALKMMKTTKAIKAMKAMKMVKAMKAMKVLK